MAEVRIGRPKVKLRDVMTRTIETIDASARVQDAALKMKTADVGMLPVTEAGRLVGIVTDRDLVIRAVCNGKTATPVRDVMSPHPVCIDQNRDIDDAIGSMIGHRVGRLVVSDEVGRIVGVLSATDVAVACSGDARVGSLANALGGAHRHVGTIAR